MKKFLKSELLVAAQNALKEMRTAGVSSSYCEWCEQHSSDDQRDGDYLAHAKDCAFNNLKDAISLQMRHL